MDILKFAIEYRLKTNKDECNDTIIKGKLGQIYEYDDDRLGVLFMPDEHNKYPERSYARKWNTVKQACLDVGMKVVQEADAEGVLTFDPSDKKQVRQALKAVRIKTRRQVSPAQLEVLAAARASKAARQVGPCV